MLQASSFTSATPAALVLNAAPEIDTNTILSREKRNGSISERRRTVASVGVIGPQELSLLLHNSATDTRLNDVGVGMWWSLIQPFNNPKTELSFLESRAHISLGRMQYVTFVTVIGMSLFIMTDFILYPETSKGSSSQIREILYIILGITLFVCAHIVNKQNFTLNVLHYFFALEFVFYLGWILTLYSVETLQMAIYSLMLYLFTVNVILLPSKGFAVAHAATAVGLYIITAAGGLPSISMDNIPTTIVNAVLIGVVVSLSFCLWITANIADRLEFSNERVLDNTWNVTRRVLAAALPRQIIPPLLDHVVARRNLFHAPAMAEPDVTIICIKFPLLSLEAVVQLNSLWTLCNATLLQFGVSIIEINDTELVGVIGLGREGVRVDNIILAIRACLAIIETLPRDLTALVTIGINSGPIVAGFVGSLRPRFTLVGEAMNAASRMATVAFPGCLTVSSTTFAAVANTHLFHSIGRNVNVKGKGDMIVYDITSISALEEARLPTVLLPLPAAGADSLYPDEISTRFTPPPFTRLSGFTDKATEARYRAQRVSPRNLQLISVLIFTALVFEIINDGDTISSSSINIFRLWCTAAAIFVAALLGLTTVVATLKPIVTTAVTTAITTYFFIVMILAPFLAQQLWTIMLSSIILGFCPIDHIAPSYRFLIYFVEATLVTLLHYINFYDTDNRPAIPLSSILWLWLMFLLATARNVNADIFNRTHFAYAEALHAAQEAGAAVLTHLLPHSILERLAAGSELTALTTVNDDCAVLVANIVGFAEMSSSMSSPTIIFKCINSAFREFERVAYAEGAFKVKTVGDSIVFTAGLKDFPGPAVDRAARVALLRRVACGIHAAASHLFLKMRIGIHVGSVVSGMLNSRGFVYDVWGEGIDHAIVAEVAAPIGGTAFTAEAVAVLDTAITTRLAAPITSFLASGRTVTIYTLLESVKAREKGVTVNGMPVSSNSLGATWATFYSKRAWSWDVFKGNDERRLPSVAFELLRPFLVNVFIPEEAASLVITQLCASYGSKLSFHNAFHAVATMHVITLFSRTVPAVQAALSDMGVMLLAFAMLGHDAGHKGYDSAYEVAICSKTALALGIDGPVIDHNERFHAAITCKILEECGALALLTLDARSAAMHTVTAAIMATDATQYSNMLTDLEQSRGLNSLTIDAINGVLAQCADNSAHVFTRLTSIIWTKRIAEEFTNQATSEDLHGLPVTQLMRNLDTPLGVARMQALFINRVVLPLWRGLANFAEGSLDEPLRNLEGNYQYYNGEVDRLTSQELDHHRRFRSCFLCCRRDTPTESSHIAPVNFPQVGSGVSHDGIEIDVSDPNGIFESYVEVTSYRI